MDPEAAETVALKALAWIVASDDLCGVFLGASGLSRDDLRDRLGEGEFLASVLDFLLMDDAWIVAFCDAEGLSYDTPLRAKVALPGGGEVHWT